jgi:D-alanine-D-alanine ligase
MTTSPPRVALLFGGRSGEHEVSVRSAQSVARGLAARHAVSPIFIDREGTWRLQPGAEPQGEGGEPVFVSSAPLDRGRLRRVADASVAAEPDVFFPVLHGTYGEDGTVQGLLELAAVPYVGSGVAASAAGMDKELMKALFAQAGLPQVPYRVVRRGEPTPDLRALGLPVFVKPANLGSSVGVSKVKRWEDLGPALETAFSFDRKVVVEAGVDAREIELSVLGNDAPTASVPGEIVPDREFYDYDSKYSADSKTELRIPAALDPAQVREVQALAVRAFRAVDAAGYSRVDFFLERGSGRFVLNEINTIPGFTSISMFPKLWEASGLAYGDLLARLVALGLERHRERSVLSTQRAG